MQYRGLLAILVLVGIAWIFSSSRWKVSPKKILGGVIAQFVFALIIFKVDFVRKIFFALTGLVHLLQESMQAGAQFVFGYLGGGPSPFQLTNPDMHPFVLALQALPLLIFMSALTSLLFYWQILPVIIKFFAFLFRKTLGIGGALGVGSAANIFFGTDAAPMCIRPHLKHMTKGELFAFMTVGMSTVAGSVMVVYSSILEGVIDGVIGHVISASVISIPAALTFAGIIEPDEKPATEGEFVQPTQAQNSMDAIASGASLGIQVYLNITAMLLVLVGLVYLANALLAYLPPLAGEPVTLQGMLGYVFSPLVWLIGVPYEQAHAAGVLMGTKTMLNEMIAYIDLSKLSTEALDLRSKTIMLYALCGFANLASVGIAIGALGTLAPERRQDVVKMGLRSVFAGTLATLSTGAVVSLFI